MVRPPLSDWETVFGFSEDPTPGAPEVLELLASEYRSVAHEADGALSVVARLDSHDLGEGKSMEALREKLAELPDQVRRLQSSYEAAADAVAKYALRLRDGQEQADRALEQGRAAKERLAAATNVAAEASAHVKRLDSAKAPPLDDEAARSSARSAVADARQAESDAALAVDTAGADLEAARMLAIDAQEIRTSDADLAKRELEDAEGEAVEGHSFWDDIGDIMNMVFSIVGAILGVIAIFVTGPVGLILAASSLALGAASLGLTIGKAIDTGKVDIVGLVLGAVGMFAGGASIVKAFSGAGSTGKLGLGAWAEGRTQGLLKGGNKKPPPQQDIELNPLPPRPPSGPPRVDVDLPGMDEWADGVRDVVNRVGNPSAPAPPPPPPTRPPPPLPSNVNKPLPPLPPLSKADALLDGLGLAIGIAGIIYSPLEYTDNAPGGSVQV